MSIPDIGITGSSIPDISLYTPPARFDLVVPQMPVGVSMELPVIQIPGCVEAHVDSGLQTELTTSDPGRVAVYCDSGMPSYDPMSVFPNRFLPVAKNQIPNTGGLGRKQEAEQKPAASPALPNPSLPDTSVATASIKQAAVTARPECSEGQVIKNGKCIELVQPKAAPQVASVVSRYLPTLEAATTTATIATVATVSALTAKPVADVLLKLIKPTIKKTINKIKKALGKKVKVQSLRERVLAQRARNQLLRQARDLMG